MNQTLTDALLVLHFLWVAWMVLGVLLAVAGFRWPRLWRWRVFRIAHLIGVLARPLSPSGRRHLSAHALGRPLANRTFRAGGSP